MSGPAPKPASKRARRNKTSTAARFETDEQPRDDAPDLGEHPEGEEWHDRTLAWWQEVWESPMANEFLRADEGGLYVLATLVDQFWRKPDRRLASEIRLQRQCYGLTPIDRRRLQWEIARAEQVTKKPQRPERTNDGDDPRSALKAI